MNNEFKDDTVTCPFCATKGGIYCTEIPASQRTHPDFEDGSMHTHHFDNSRDCNCQNCGCEFNIFIPGQAAMTDMHREAFERMVSQCYPNFADFGVDEDGDYYDEALIDMHRGWILHARFALEQAAIRHMTENEQRDSHE